MHDCRKPRSLHPPSGPTRGAVVQDTQMLFRNTCYRTSSAERRRSVPPQQKFTRDEVVGAALGIVRAEGLSGVTARSLGAALGSSSRPIFTAFRNMDEVCQATSAAARRVYDEFIGRGLDEPNSFKGVGMQYVRFAREEPQLFRLLFMNANGAGAGLDDVLHEIDHNSERILDSLQSDRGVSRAEAIHLHQRMWIFAHGIACLCVTEVGSLKDEEVSSLLTDAFTGLLLAVKRRDGAA